MTNKINSLLTGITTLTAIDPSTERTIAAMGDNELMAKCQSWLFDKYPKARLLAWSSSIVDFVINYKSTAYYFKFGIKDGHNTPLYRALSEEGFKVYTVFKEDEFKSICKTIFK